MHTPERSIYIPWQSSARPPGWQRSKRHPAHSELQKPLEMNDILSQFKERYGADGEKALMTALHHEGALLCEQLNGAKNLAHMHITAYVITYLLRDIDDIRGARYTTFAREQRTKFKNLLDEHGVILTDYNGDAEDIDIAIELATSFAIQDFKYWLDNGLSTAEFKEYMKSKLPQGSQTKPQPPSQG